MIKKTIQILKGKSIASPLLNQGIIFGSNLLVFAFITRLFSAQELGSYIVFLTISSVLELTRNGLVQNGLIKFSTENPDEKTKIRTAGLLLYIAISLLIYLVMLSIGNLSSSFFPEYAILTLSQNYWIILLGPGLMYFLSILLQSEEKHNHVSIINFRWYGGIFIGMGAFYIWNQSLNPYQLQWIYGFAGFAAFLIAVKQNPGLLSIQLPGKTWIVKLINFGKYVFGTNLLSMMMNKTDILMLTIFSNPFSVAVYHVAFKVSNYLEIPLNAAAQYYFPKIAGSADSKPETERLLHQSVALQLSMTLPIIVLLFIFSREVVTLIGGQIYAEQATILLRILLFGAIIKPVGRSTGILLDAINKPKVNFTLLVGSIILNVVLNAILIRFYGAFGVAMATVTSIWLTIGAGQYYLRPFIRFSFVKAFYATLNNYKKSNLNKVWN